MARKLHGDAGICQVCGRVGPTWIDLDKDYSAELCDCCNWAQARWDAYIWHQRHGTESQYWAVYGEPPPKTPPLRQQLERMS